MNAAQWWAGARARWLDGDVTRPPGYIEAWHDLDVRHRRRLHRRVKTGLRHADQWVRRFAHRVAADIAVAMMDTAQSSNHLRLELAAARLRQAPLKPGEVVPGCSCAECTGLPDDHPARLPSWRRANWATATGGDDQRRRRWERRVDAARRISIVDIAQMLGCGDPVRRGRALHVCCPLHDDVDPSCRLDIESNVWFCDPCAVGGDAISLYMRARRLDFADAVRELGT